MPDSVEEMAFIQNEPEQTSEIETTPVVNNKSLIKLNKKGVVSTAILGIALTFLSFTFVISLLFRQPIVASWPSTTIFYKTFGLDAPPPGYGLSIKDVSISLSPETDNKNQTVHLSGEIANNTKKEILLPNLLILMQKDGKRLQQWPINLHGRSLHSQKRVDFKYDLENKKGLGDRVTIRFSD